LVADELEALDSKLANTFVVLDQKDGLTRLRVCGALLEVVGWTRDNAVCTGEIEIEDRAVSDFAIDGDVAAALIDEAIDHRQADPRTAAFLFGGEERLEHTVPNLRRHARSGVGDG